MTRPILLGLTGSIGMGKSTTAEMFRALGCAVWDADAAVHRLYTPGGAAVAPIAAAFPDAIVAGGVSRDRLKAALVAEPKGFARLNAIVHPLVAADRAAAVANTAASILVCDIPLLFETGADAEMDATAVVSAPPELQRARVLDRPDMTPDQFEMILAHQMPDAEKRARAEYIIPTTDMDAARQAVQNVVSELEKTAHARDRS